MTRRMWIVAFASVVAGDYPCPPCRMASSAIEAWQRIAPATVTFEFRNFPLSEIHPQAVRYARLAESSEPARFWAVHRSLFDQQASCGAEKEPALGESLPPLSAEAKQRLDEDAAFVRKNDLQATPTLFFVAPSGSVYRCPSVEAAKRLQSVEDSL